MESTRTLSVIRTNDCVPDLLYILNRKRLYISLTFDLDQGVLGGGRDLRDAIYGDPLAAQDVARFFDVVRCNFKIRVASFCRAFHSFVHYVTDSETVKALCENEPRGSWFYSSDSSIFPLLTSNNSPPIWMQTLPRHKTTIRPCQKYKTRCNLTWLSRSSHRTSKLVLRFLVHGCRDQRCPDRSRTNRVDSDPIANLLIRERPCESNDGTLCRSVVE